MIGLGYVLCGLVATVAAAPFLAVVIGYFLIAFVLTVMKAISLKEMALNRLNLLVFEFITIAGFILLLFTCEQ